MSNRVSTNIAFMPNRRIAQIYGAGPAFDALSTADPNTLNSNLPNKKDATGISGQECIISFEHDYVSSDPTITCWLWSEIMNQFNPAYGWVKANEDAAGNSKTVPGKTLCSFTIPESTPFYLQASTTGIRNVWIAGSRRAPLNPNADMSPSAANT